MSDEPIPHTDLAPPPVMPPPVVTPAPLPPPKSVTPAWVFTLLKTVLAVLVITLVTNCSAASAKGRPPVKPIPATDHSFVFTSAQSELTFHAHEWN